MNISRPGFLGSLPPVTKNIIIISALLWLAQIVLLRSGVDIVQYLGLHYVESKGFRLHQFVTYMFQHDTRSIMHVLFNMFAVFMFGRTLEQVWGPKRFLTYYFVTGVGAALVQMCVIFIRVHAMQSGMDAVNVAEVYQNGYDAYLKGMNYTNSAMAALNSLINTPTVGASGAVFGILLAFGMMFPNAELFIIPFPFPIKAKWFVIGYGVIELIFGIRAPGDNVAHFAHLGGMLFGIFMILYWRKKNKTNVRYY